MSNADPAPASNDSLVNELIDAAVGMITRPTSFFRDMKKSGGFLQPLIFAVAMGVLAGLVRAVVALVGLSGTSSIFMAIGAIFLVPIFVAIGSFIGAAIAFLIWKVMGSAESYETAYRCGAFAMAIAPIVALVEWLPYLGGVLGIAWYVYLMILASVHVHAIAPNVARMVFGIVGGLLIVISLGMELAARQLTSNLQKYVDAAEGSEEEMEDALETMERFLRDEDG